MVKVSSLNSKTCSVGIRPLLPIILPENSSSSSLNHLRTVRPSRTSTLLANALRPSLMSPAWPTMHRPLPTLKRILLSGIHSQLTRSILLTRLEHVRITLIGTGLARSAVDYLQASGDNSSRLIEKLIHYFVSTGASLYIFFKS